jgi:carbon storage regulator CsrA
VIQLTISEISLGFLKLHSQRDRFGTQFAFELSCSSRTRAVTDAQCRRPVTAFEREYLTIPANSRNKHMLVLTRKPNQSVRIGESITVNIVRIRGNTVQLGIQAPKDVGILRTEIIDRQSAEPGAAAEPKTEESAASDDENELHYLECEIVLDSMLGPDIRPENATKPRNTTLQLLIAP